MIEAIIIHGPTASGKTELAIRVAQHFNTEIISFDSRQFYREMHIGTAKPTQEQLGAVRHHFIDSNTLSDPLNVSSYMDSALPIIKRIGEQFGRVVLTGGSNQFLDGLTFGLDPVPVFPEIRKELEHTHIHKGIMHLQNMLRLSDPGLIDTLDMNNARRVIRALEVLLGSGKSISHFQTATKSPRFNYVRFGLQMEREILYERINQRVDQMILAGLEQEVRQLEPFWNHEVFRTVGYQEWIPYFQGKVGYNDVVDNVKKHTRNYAKRQSTWMKKYKDMHWICSVTSSERLDTIVQTLN